MTFWGLKVVELWHCTIVFSDVDQLIGSSKERACSRCRKATSLADDRFVCPSHLWGSCHLLYQQMLYSDHKKAWWETDINQL